MRINSLPRAGSGVGTSNARELFRGVKLDYEKDMCLSFGDYVQAHRAAEVKGKLTKPSSSSYRQTSVDKHTDKDLTLYVCL